MLLKTVTRFVSLFHQLFCHVANLSYVPNFIMSSSALRNFNCVALNRRKSWSAILLPLINSPGQVKFSICNSNWPQCKRRQGVRGRAARRCLSSISTRERGRVQSMRFMLITMPFHGEQIGSFCMHLSNKPPIYLNELAERWHNAEPGLSSKRCGMLTSHTELKHHFFNLFISCHSTFLQKRHNFHEIHSFDLKTGNTPSKRWHRKCSILMTTEAEWPRGTLTHQRFF